MFSFTLWCAFLVLASLVAQIVKNLPAMRDTGIQSLGWKDPLGKGMATHSSILAWRIPWTEEPGGLPSMGSQRVGHDWATNTHIHIPNRLLAPGKQGSHHCHVCISCIQNKPRIRGMSLSTEKLKPQNTFTDSCFPHSCYLINILTISTIFKSL